MADEFVPENDIERLMVEARAGRAPMTTFMRALLRWHVFAVPGEGAGEGGYTVPAQQGRDGGLYILVFTSHDRLKRFTGQEEAIRLPLQELAGSWPDGVSLVVNPGDGVELVMPGEDLLSFAAGKRAMVDENVVPAGTTVYVGDPAVEPEAALEAVARVLAGRPEVAAAYRAQIAVERPGEEPGLAIGLVLDAPPTEGDESLQAAVAEAAIAGGAPEVSIMRLDPAGTGNAIADHMLQRTRPFYERRR
jgi:SseB protein C-terminal domain/SseB protein N-terminal domain